MEHPILCGHRTPEARKTHAHRQANNAPLIMPSEWIIVNESHNWKRGKIGTQAQITISPIPAWPGAANNPQRRAQ